MVQVVLLVVGYWSFDVLPAHLHAFPPMTLGPAWADAMSDNGLYRTPGLSSAPARGARFNVEPGSRCGTSIRSSDLLLPLTA